MDILMDVGRSINPNIDYGQIEGAAVQGMGWSTIEESLWLQNGAIFTTGPGQFPPFLSFSMRRCSGTDYRGGLFFRCIQDSWVQRCSTTIQRETLARRRLAKSRYDSLFERNRSK